MAEPGCPAIQRPLGPTWIMGERDGRLLAFNSLNVRFRFPFVSLGLDLLL